MGLSIQPADIKELRERLRLKQREFSDLLEVDLRSVQNYESGKTRPRGDTFDKILLLMEENPKVHAEVVYEKDKIIRHIADNRDEYLNDPLFMSLVGLIEIGELREENAKIKEELSELIQSYKVLAQRSKFGQ